MWPNGTEPEPGNPGADTRAAMTEDQTLLIESCGEDSKTEWIESDEWALLSLEA